MNDLNENLVIGMCGLPARGKVKLIFQSYLGKQINEYFNK